MFDTTNKKTFDQLDYWLKEGKKNGLEKPKMFLCGTKADLTGKRSVTEGDARSWASSKKMRYYEVSAKENKGVTEMFGEITSMALR